MSIEIARAITGYYEVTGYGWIIDEDHLFDPKEDGASDKGVMGPSRITPEITTQLNKGEGMPFRMYDDDGELYYSGRLIVPEGEEWGDLFFRPLSDFGGPNAGATEIHYKNDRDQWESL